jgi:hypothetical protein
MDHLEKIKSICHHENKCQSVTGTWMSAAKKAKFDQFLLST